MVIIRAGSTSLGGKGWLRGQFPREICQYSRWTGASSAASMTRCSSPLTQSRSRRKGISSSRRLLYIRSRWSSKAKGTRLATQVAS